MTGEGGDAGATRGQDRLGSALADLKRRGSSLLVVGTVPHEAYVRASRRMLGAADVDPPRRRLVVVPDADGSSAAGRLDGTGPLDPRYARVVTCTGVVRGGTAAAGDGGSCDDPARPGAAPGPNAPGLASADRPDGPRVRTVGCTPDEIGDAVTEVVDQFDAAAGGFAPAEFRVAFDCLPPLISAHDLGTVFAFLGVFAWQVRSVKGIGHVRLPRAYDDRTARTIAPLFDGVLELRLAGRRLEQRWHLRDGDLVSDWMPTDASERPELDD